MAKVIDPAEVGDTVMYVDAVIAQHPARLIAWNEQTGASQIEVFGIRIDCVRDETDSLERSVTWCDVPKLRAGG